MKRVIICFVLLFASYVSAENFPDQTGIILTDLEGQTYNIDALLNEGKHIFVHQMYSG